MNLYLRMGGGVQTLKNTKFSNFRFSLILLLIRFRTEFKIIIQLSYFSFVGENLTNYGFRGGVQNFEVQIWHFNLYY